MKIKLPVLIINFKTYRNGTGEKALEIAKQASKIAKKLSVNIALAVQAPDIYRIAKNVDIPVLAQHVDPVVYGAHTGHLLPEAVKEAGAVGTLLNHAEHRLGLEILEECIKRCQEIKLQTIVCTENLEEAAKIAGLEPDFIAFEDPVLIGTGKPISKLKSESVKKFASMFDRKPIPLCGSGISSEDDVKTALELGTKGVIVASAIMLSLIHI